MKFNRFVLVPFAVSALIAWASVAHSSEIKIDDIMANTIYNEIKGNENHPFVRDAISKLCTGGGIYYKRMCEAALKLGAFEVELKDYQFTDRGVEYSHLKSAPIPEEIERSYYGVKNCTSLDKNISESVTVVSTERSSIKKLDKISSSSSSNFEANLKIDGFGLTGSGGSSKTVDFSTENSSESSKTTTRESSFSETVPAYSALVLIVEQTYSNGYMDFLGDIEADADIYVDGKLIGKFSNFFDLGIIEVKGEIWNTEYSSLSKNYIEIPLPSDHLECYDEDLSEFGFNVEIL